MSQRFRSAFAAPTGFVAAVTRAKPAADAVGRSIEAAPNSLHAGRDTAVPVTPRLAA